MAIPGEEGTLDDRLTKEPYRSNVWAKTGYINGVSALSGYAKGRNGKLYAFSVLVNGIKGGTRKAKRLQDAVARLLVDQR
jgi:D-alanyl-D-alanine carboxypeptidase/D-alanyl-D-alanine-endopeptidase (penicillin-binding protein 4)